jgi:hypothetical protein
MHESRFSVSACPVRTAFWTASPHSARVLVHVYFEGSVPPIIGYWTMN